MRIYTELFVQWLANQYNIAEDQIFKHKGHTYKYYSIEELVEKFKKEYDAEAIVTSEHK